MGLEFWKGKREDFGFSSAYLAYTLRAISLAAYLAPESCADALVLSFFPTFLFFDSIPFEWLLSI
jgi:hypothetical protein